MLNVTPGADGGSSNGIGLEDFPAPIGKLLGLKLSTPADGQATVEFEATERHANPMGTLHGGVLCDIADAAMGAAYRGSLTDGESFTTLERRSIFCGQSGRRSCAPKPGWFERAAPWVWWNATFSTNGGGWWRARPAPA
jgi:hypothetical protein